MSSKYNILVLCGGGPEERGVSLATGEHITSCLREMGHDVSVLDIVKVNLIDYLSNISVKPDLIFNALHGKHGEDGEVQAIFEYFRIPYTHSNVCASAVAMNKNITSLIAESIGLTCPLYQVLSIQEYIGRQFWGEHIIKPTDNGSTVGVRLIKNIAEKEAFHRDLESTKVRELYENKILVQQFIQGIELTVPVLSGVAMECIEIAYDSDIFDEQTKYNEHDHQYRIYEDKEVRKLCCSFAEKIHNAIGCRGITRSDFMYDPQIPNNKGLYYLETNSQPGLSKISIVPTCAKLLDMDFHAILSIIIHDALDKSS